MRPSPGSRPRRAPWRWLCAAANPLVLLFLVLPPPPTVGSPQERLRQACNTCRGITERFSKGLTDTAKKNFGGGNTAWEEKTLSKYESSEIRLVEIIENLCDSSNFECNNMVEEHEERIETWWFKWKKKYPDLFKWFCIETIEVCCPPGTHGPDCLAPSLKELAVGDRKGLAMVMAIVMEMAPGVVTDHAAVKKSTKENFAWTALMATIAPTETIHILSVQLVTIPVKHAPVQLIQIVRIVKKVGPKMKKPVWAGAHSPQQHILDISIRSQASWGIWEDVDECAVEDSPCRSDQYCLNTEGSFSCKACDRSCLGCTGEGSSKCKSCTSGYEMKDGTCTDVDECSLSEKVCVRENEDCLNTPGSYRCACSEGFQDQDGVCVPTPKAGG
ncbi:Cysteine-rich with EGF-like domain protein 2 [Varanus komodoensis]|nr:Cysteine-rich with EGF-like domain protein 2 [Varanus komodoensis]